MFDETKCILVLGPLNTYEINDNTISMQSLFLECLLNNITDGFLVKVDKL